MWPKLFLCLKRALQMGILPVSTSTTQIKGKCYEKIIMNKEKERKS
jgi:hypothetical protein